MKDRSHKDDTTEVAALRNIGPVSARMLAEVGIVTRGDLDRAGAVLAYRVLKERHPGVSLNLLYAMYGALTDQRWDQLPVALREELRREAEEASRVLPRPG